MYCHRAMTHVMSQAMTHVLSQVMTHEISHMFGLQHCYYFECALNESSSIAEAEQQPLFLCPVCLRKLHKVLKFDVAKRYHLLHQKLIDVYITLEAPQVMMETVAKKPDEQPSSENPHGKGAPIIISSSPGRIPSGVDQPTKTEATKFQQEKFTNAIEWLKKCIHFIDSIT